MIKIIIYLCIWLLSYVCDIFFLNENEWVISFWMSKYITYFTSIRTKCISFLIHSNLVKRCISQSVLWMLECDLSRLGFPDLKIIVSEEKMQEINVLNLVFTNLDDIFKHFEWPKWKGKCSKHNDGRKCRIRWILLVFGENIHVYIHIELASLWRNRSFRRKKVEAYYIFYCYPLKLAKVEPIGGVWTVIASNVM